MSVTQVYATIKDDSVSLESSSGNSYSGSMSAPDVRGNYSVSVTANDDAGNVSVATSVLNVMLWHTPKTDWKSTDRFNISDYNRIKNNLEHLHKLSCDLQMIYGMPNMGGDILDYSPYWEVEKFNLFETNLDLINKHIFTQDYGTAQRFLENGAFIKWDELNRIESAILSMNELLEMQKNGLRKIGFRLGQYREVRL